MKIKNAVIPFIPLTLLMLVFKLASLFALDSNGLFLGMNGMTLTYLVIGLTIALFILCVVINIFDRKTAPVYAVKKNPVAGVLAILTGLSIAASSIFGVVSNQAETEYYVMTLITAALAVPAAIALIIMSKVHFSGKSTISTISLLYVFPSLWGCAELVTEFLNATKVSISATDMTSLFCYIFLTLYLYSHSMIVSKIVGKHPVKSCFIYGLPAVAISLTFGVYEILYASRAVENFGVATILLGVQFVIAGLYVLSFLIELSKNVMTKAEVEILDSMPDDEDPKEESYASTANYDDDLVISDSESISNNNNGYISDYVSNQEEINDFILGYDAEEAEEPIPYFTKEEMAKSAEFDNLFVAQSNYDDKRNLIKHKKSAKKTVVQPEPEQSLESITENKIEEIKEEKQEAVTSPEIPATEKTVDNRDDEIEEIISESREHREKAEKEEQPTEDEKLSKRMQEIDDLLKSLDDLK